LSTREDGTEFHRYRKEYCPLAPDKREEDVPALVVGAVRALLLLP